MHLNPIAVALDAISLGPVVSAENSTMIPLLRKDSPQGTPSTQSTPGTQSTPCTQSTPGTQGTPGTPGTQYIVLDDALSAGQPDVALG